MSEKEIIDLFIFLDRTLLIKNVTCDECKKRRAYFHIRYTVRTGKLPPYNIDIEDIRVCLDCAKKFVAKALEEMLK